MTRLPDVFAYCQGVVPLRPRLENWMLDLLGDVKRLRDLTQAFGAPLNIQCDVPFQRNVKALTDCVSEFDIPFLPMFARKANKCLTYVNTAHQMGIGIDTASHFEVAQCLGLGVQSDRIVCTAAVKDRALMTLCAANNVPIILDNLDEVTLLQEIVRGADRTVSVGLRLNGFERNGKRLYSRFGFPLGDISSVVDRLSETPQITLIGLHFHLNGYSAEDRIAAIAQTLPLIKQIRGADQRDFFLDIGGGIPMNYLADARQWANWVSQLDAAVRGTRDPITQHNDGLGRRFGPEGFTGNIDSYPVAQSLVQADWMCKVLMAEHEGQSIANRLRDAHLSLRCEPGRSLLDGCGVTVARVAFCKTDSKGTAVIGVQMNRTQSRSGFAEFALDPLMVPTNVPRGEPLEGYLAGTYCTESEWLTRRKMSFPRGVQAGDLMVFPNTAGYLMHFLESRSHQFPLAQNVFIHPDSDKQAELDGIETI